MPFIIAFAITLHVAVLAPLFIVARQSDQQLDLDPLTLLGWPLAIAIVSGFVLGALLRLAEGRGWSRVLAVTAAIGIALYAQFYLLVWDFGAFDGRVIAFDQFALQGAVEIGVWAAALAVAVIRPSFATALFGRLLGVLAALCVGSAIWTAVSQSPDRGREEPVAQAPAGPLATATFLRDPKPIPGINALSAEKNVIIILLDTLQADLFEQAVNNEPGLRTQFSGFKLFTNAAGHFPYTGLSIPAILTGDVYGLEGETIQQYMKRAASERLEVRLADKGFAASRIPLHNRANYLNSQGSECRRFGQAYDLYGFRQVPVALKPWFYDESRFRLARLCSGLPPTESERDLLVMQRLAENSALTAAKPTVKYIHLWGAHPPTMLDTNCTVRKSSFSLDDRPDQARCLLRATGQYLDKLRSLGVFDKSLVFILSDHGTRSGFLKRTPVGTAPGFVMSSANPTIAFHDMGDTRPFRTSPAPVVLADVVPTIMAKLGFPVNEGGVDIDTVKDDADRVRSFTFFRNAGDIQYDFLPVFSQFTIRGSVRDPSAWSPSGAAKVSQLDSSLSAVDFSKPTISRYLGLGWSAEAAGIAHSWVIASPAVVSGVLPASGKARLTINVLNPHEDQHVAIAVNGRDIAEWDSPHPHGWEKHVIEFDLRADERGQPARIDVLVRKVDFTGGERARQTGIAVNELKVEPAS
jgi:hypothetical protein